jgi:hypothetical protein
LGARPVLPADGLICERSRAKGRVRAPLRKFLMKSRTSRPGYASGVARRWWAVSPNSLPQSEAWRSWQRAMLLAEQRSRSERITEAVEPMAAHDATEEGLLMTRVDGQQAYPLARMSATPRNFNSSGRSLTLTREPPTRRGSPPAQRALGASSGRAPCNDHGIPIWAAGVWPHRRPE